MTEKGPSAKDSYFKADIALQVLQGTPVARLVEEHSLSKEQIEEWKSRIMRLAHLLFPDDEGFETALKDIPAKDAGSIRDYAALLRSTFEATPNGIFVTNLDRKVITYNQRCLDMWEVPTQIVATNDLDLILEYAVKQIMNPEAYQNLVLKQHEHPEEESSDLVEFKNGRFLKRDSIPYRAGNTILGRVTSFTDVTDLKQAQKKADEYASMLNSITENVSEGILRSTPDDGLVYINDSFVEIFGYASKEEVLDQAPEVFYAYAAQRGELVDRLKEQGRLRNEEVLMKRKDGSTFWALENSILTENNGRLYIDAVINDISERKKAALALRQSEEKYRNILENIEDGYFETNLKGDMVFYNEALRRALGYKADELNGLNNREYMDEYTAERVYQMFNKVYRTGQPEKAFDWEWQRKDGSKLFAEASVSPRKDANGKVIGFRGLVRDITERKHNEEKIKASLKEKEVLLGEIHHRVKNNLAVISGLLYLQAEGAHDEQARSLLSQSQSRINSMAMVHEMLYENHTFSKVDPGRYIEQLIDQISTSLREGGREIQTSLQTEDLQFDMSIAMPCALIINELITNAYKHAFKGRDKGMIKIKITHSAPVYRIEISDNGVGLPENLDKESAEDGLGLFLVETLVQQIRGELEISAHNGSRFIITFPDSSKSDEN